LIRGERARGAGGWAGAEGVADPRAAAVGVGVDLAGAAAPCSACWVLIAAGRGSVTEAERLATVRWWSGERKCCED